MWWLVWLVIKVNAKSNEYEYEYEYDVSKVAGSMSPKLNWRRVGLKIVTPSFPKPHIPSHTDTHVYKYSLFSAFSLVPPNPFAICSFSPIWTLSPNMISPILKSFLRLSAHAFSLLNYALQISKLLFLHCLFCLVLFLWNSFSWLSRLIGTFFVLFCLIR